MQFTVGTVIDIIMAACMLFAIVRGWQTGLVIKLAHLAAIIVSYALANGIATLLKSKIGSEVILPLIEENGGEEALSIPYAKEGITLVADNIAYYLISAICFLIAIIVLYQLIKVFHLVDHVPVVGKLNKAGGAVAGFLVEFVFFYIICNIIFNIMPQATLDQLGLSEEVISHTYLLRAFIN